MGPFVNSLSAESVSGELCLKSQIVSILIAIISQDRFHMIKA